MFTGVNAGYFGFPAFHTVPAPQLDKRIFYHWGEAGGKSETAGLLGAFYQAVRWTRRSRRALSDTPKSDGLGFS